MTAPLTRFLARLLPAAGLVVALALSVACGASWAAFTADGTGSARAVATSLPTPSAPTATVAVDKVTLSWPSVVLRSGAAGVTGYVVTRWSAATGGTGVAACNVTTTSCVDTPGAGTSYYSVRAQARSWSSSDSTRTAATVSGAPVMGAATIGGTILAGFVRPGGAYAVYAQVTGASTVTADLTGLGGAATQAMTAGSWTVGGVTYGWAVTGLTAGAALPDGTTTARITAKSATNLTATTAATVVVDGSVTTTTLATLPSRIHNGQAISATATDAGSGVATLQVVWCAGSTCTPVAGTNVVGSTTTSTLSTTWNSQPNDGTYRVAAIATDRIGNSKTSTVQTVVVDNTGPRLTGWTTTQPAGGTAGRLEPGDVLRFQLDDVPATTSLPAATTVTLSRTGNGAVTMAVPGVLSGTPSLGSSSYLAGNGSKTATFSATVTVSGSVVVVTVGPATGSSDPTGVGSAASLNLILASTVLDLAGNPASTANLSLSSYLAF